MASGLIPITQLPGDFTSADAPPAPSSALPADVQGGPIMRQGMLWPVSIDASGGRHFDMTAGLPGALWNAVTLPADVYSGKTPVHLPNGQYNPDLLNRSLNFAMLAGGDMSPGTGQMVAAAAPTEQALKAAGGAGYDALRNSGLELDPGAVASAATGLQNDLTRQGFGAAVAPSTHAVLDQVANPPKGAISTVNDLLAIRQNLGNLSMAGGQEGAAGGIAKRGFDSFLGSADPASVLAGTIAPQDAAAMLRDAAGNYGAAMRSNEITGALDSANTGIAERAEARAHASHSGANIDNAIRQRVASYLQNPSNVAGLAPNEIAALNGVVQGGIVQNLARRIGNIAGGGGGLGQLAAGTAGALAGGHIMGPEGAALGAMIPTAIGMTAKGVENSLSRRLLNNAAAMIRQNSPLYRQAPTTLDPFDRSLTVLRSILPGMFMPQPAPQPPPGLLSGGPLA